MGKHLAGRRLAKRSSSLRSPSSPRSGRRSWGALSHLGPPTAPNRIASLSSQSRSVDWGSGSPVASMAAPPTRADSNSKDAPVAFPTTWRIFWASGVTSCPMPSPASTAILWVVIRSRPQTLLLGDVLHEPAGRHDFLGEGRQRLRLAGLLLRQVLDLARGGVDLQHVVLVDADCRLALEQRCPRARSEEHTSELQSHHDLVCRLLLEKKKRKKEEARKMIETKKNLDILKP